jgi:hypothetical protein
MESPDQNKIVGRELAVARAHWGPIDEKKEGYIFKEQLVADPVTLELYGVTQEAMLDCVKQLEAMGTYDEVSKEQGYDEGGYKPTGLVIISKSDPRVKCSVEFGHRWNKDSALQSITPPSEIKAITLKWFMDVDNQDKEMGKGAVQERPVSPEELDLITKIREMTKETKVKSESRIIQPVLEAVKSHKDYLTENKKMTSEASAQGPTEPGMGGMDYERDVVAPAWQKWTAKGGKPHYLGCVTLKDEEGDETGRVQVYQATHEDHRNLPGIHLIDPEQSDVDEAIETASAQDFGEIIIHGEIPPGIQLEGKEIKGVIMKEKRTFGMDCESVDFFGLPIFEEKKPVAEAESTYSPTWKTATAPLVQKDPEAYNKTVDQLKDKKMKTKEDKPAVMGVDKPLAKPESEVGTEYGEKPLTTKNQLGKPGADHGAVAQATGKSDDQQTELPAAKIKVGKPGADSGKHMEDSKSYSRRDILKEWETQKKETSMLRRTSPLKGAKDKSIEKKTMLDQTKKVC